MYVLSVERNVGQQQNIHIKFLCALNFVRSIANYKTRISSDADNRV